MKKSMILAAVAAIVLSACAKIETEKPVVDEPINFAAYSGNAITKAGAYGEETPSPLPSPSPRRRMWSRRTVWRYSSLPSATCGNTTALR